MPHQRQIIILDALDEADVLFQPAFLPYRLPDGIYLVVSARAVDQGENGDRPPYFEGWSDGAAFLHLERLPEVAMAKWLAQAGDGQLTEESRDPVFVDRLSHLTDGYPLYLNFLIDDLVEAKKSGRDPDAILANTPKGFAAYVRGQRRQISLALGREREVRDLFILLAVARYPLLASEVSQLTGMDEFDLEDLPPGVTRWFNITQDTDGERSYALAHARLAQEFENAWRQAAGDIQARLLAWCAEWETNRSPYTLRHYAELLRQAQRWAELYDLARDEEYASCQQQELPAEPDLPLRTVRLALDLAAIQEQAGLMAEFLLEHARRILALRQISPLEALRMSKDEIGLNRAWQLAGAHDNERRVLWLLLLAWILTEGEHHEKARVTLERLNRGRLPVLSERWDTIATFLLAQLTRSQPVAGIALIDTTLSDGAKLRASQLVLKDQAFALALEMAGSIGREGMRAAALGVIATAQATAGDFDGALETAGGIGREWRKAATLGVIAAAQAEAGLKGTAADTFALALETAGGIGLEWQKAKALGEIAVAQAKAGLKEASSDTFVLALETTGGIGLEGSKVEALREIVSVQIEMGDFDGALETASSIGLEWQKAKVLGEIAVAQAKAGLKEASSDTFALALETASGRSKARVLGEIAAALAEARDFDGARETASSIGLEWQKASLRVIAAAQARAGDFDGAWETAGGIGHGYLDNRAKVLREIAAAQAEAGDFDGALEKAGSIGDRMWKARALGSIAAFQARAGLKEAAAETFSMALETAGSIDREMWKAPALSVIAAAQATAGDFDGARETAGSIGDEEKASALGVIAAAQARAGDFDGARETAGDIGYEWRKVAALGEIAAVQARAGDFDGARETAGGIGGGRSKAEALGNIATAQAGAGLKEAAADTFALARETAGGIVNEKSKAEALGAIAEAQAKTGNFERALETVVGIGDEEQKSAALRAIAVAQVKAGLGAQAVRTASLILANLDWNLSAIALSLTQAGDKENFWQMLPICANVPEAALLTCSAIVSLYPKQATGVVNVVINQTWE